MYFLLLTSFISVPLGAKAVPNPAVTAIALAQTPVAQFSDAFCRGINECVGQVFPEEEKCRRAQAFYQEALQRQTIRAQDSSLATGTCGKNNYTCPPKENAQVPATFHQHVMPPMGRAW